MGRHHRLRLAGPASRLCIGWLISLALALLGFPSVRNATLLGHWHFDEGSGTTTADSSGTGNNGTLAGSPIPVWVTPGAVGLAALDFTPTARVSLPNSASLQLTGPLTLSAWTWADSLLGSGRIITKGGGSGSRGWSLGVESGGYYAFQIPSSGTVLVSLGAATSTPVTLGVWTHVVGVYDPSGTPSMKIYTTGILAATLTTGVPATMYNPPSISPSIGTRSDGTTRWDGKLDEVRIYNEALSQAQIQALPELVQNPMAFTLEPASVARSGTTAASRRFGPRQHIRRGKEVDVPATRRV